MNSQPISVGIIRHDMYVAPRAREPLITQRDYVHPDTPALPYTAPREETLPSPDNIHVSLPNRRILMTSDETLLPGNGKEAFPRGDELKSCGRIRCVFTRCRI